MVKKAFLLALLALIAACSAPQKPLHRPTSDPYAAPTEPTPSRAEAPERSAASVPQWSGAEGAAEAESAAPRAYDDSASGALGPEHRGRRPGLGTSWGETRYSHAHEVTFERASDGPSGTAQIHYDDMRGIRNLLGRPFSISRDHRVYLAGGALSARIVGAHSEPLPGVSRGNHAYVIGQLGERYQIEVTNHSGMDFEVVASVDGLDVLDGEAADFSKRGYILRGYETLQIDGFRRSLAEVAAFRFGATDSAYASLKGQGQNVGVIGIAVFEEAGAYYPPYPDETWHRRNADPFPGRFATPPR